MPALDDLKTTTKTLAGDNTKTETQVESKETKKDKPNLEVSVTTTSLPGDPNKSETVIKSVGNRVKLQVVGPFNGSADVEAGSVLRDVLPRFNTEEDTYGKFKYRDEKDNSVGLNYHVDRDTVLTSIRKG